MRLPFIGGAYESSSKTISAQEAINIYPEVGIEASNQVSLKGVEGTIERVDLGGAIRSLHTAYDVLYAVGGSNVYSIDSGWNATLLGSVANDNLPACMAHNIFEVLVLSGGSGSVVQKGATTLTAITDPDFPNASRCGFVDGYGVLIEKDSGRLWFTTINDFETISGIDFITAEGAPDDLVSMVIDHREVWLPGKVTTEVWGTTTDANNPFQRVPGGFLERGCLGAHSPAKLDNTVFWLGQNKVVYRADGLLPIRISNHGIENLIRKVVDPDKGIGMAYSHTGHEFYMLTFPGELTCVYDASTQVWHTRRNRGREDSVYQHHAFVYGKNVVGGVDGKIYELDEDTYTHAGTDLERIRTIGPIRVDGFSVMDLLTFILETGENSDALNEKKVFIEISDDAGKTYSGRLEGSIGKQGEHQIEVAFHLLGGFYDNQRCIRLTMTDNAKYALVDVLTEIS